jgi:hypothetical protein
MPGECVVAGTAGRGTRRTCARRRTTRAAPAPPRADVAAPQQRQRLRHARGGGQRGRCR